MAASSITISLPVFSLAPRPIPLPGATIPTSRSPALLSARNTVISRISISSVPQALLLPASTGASLVNSPSSKIITTGSATSLFTIPCSSMPLVLLHSSMAAATPPAFRKVISSLHFQPIKLIGFGLNYNFFRQLPTFDPRLIGTGLLDKYLFQGLSADVRLDLPNHISLYTALGRSKTTTDTQSSLNQSYGITLANFWKTGLLFDAHYSKFNSDFGSGNYESVSLSKSLTDTLHLQLMAGIQKFNSPNTSNTNANFVTGTLDYSFGRRYFVEALLGWYQGTTLNYTQWTTTFGYRFGGLRH